MLLALIQVPLFYYGVSGIAGVFFIAIYLIIGLSLTVYLIIQFFGAKNDSRNLRYKGITIVTIILGTYGIVFGDRHIEYLDWQSNYDRRMKIVSSFLSDPPIKANMLKRINTFVPISNGGNEVPYERFNDGSVEIQFFIDRGLLDSYSAWVYTNSEERMQQLNDNINLRNDEDISRQISDFWFRISY